GSRATPSRVHRNPYELMTFYDNHDMPRMDADSSGFIDAHNWLFTSRGIPVVYYGSEAGFRAGRAEHAGNRDYFGADGIAAARSHPVHAALTRIANLRKRSVALQRGVQVNLEFGDDTAAFYRVFRRQNVSETALVLLNKGDESVTLDATNWLASGSWKDAFSGEPVEADSGDKSVTIDAHAVRVLISADALPEMRHTSP
ncbi:MAG: alpha-amylase family glycosyl hydrolase, partial [Pseudomonadota bacterium]